MDDQQALDTILHSLAPYRIHEKKVTLTKTVLGRGGFGVVVLGETGRSIWKRKKGRQVAVKQLQASGTLAENRKLALALVQELHVWAGLAHPNILRLEGFFLDDRLERAWLISPYMKNGSVRTYLDEHNPNMIVRFRMSGQIASGVAYLHQRNICHGDIKGANILVDSDGQAKLCDFGLTKVMESATTTGMSSTEPKGTTRYMAPELFHNASRTKKSDVWAWSCLGLEILFDQIPYGDVNGNMAIMNRIVRGDPPLDLDGIDVDLSIKELFQGCWVAEPLERVTIRTCLNTVECVIDELMQHQAGVNPDETLSTVHRMIALPTSDDITSSGARVGSLIQDGASATPSSSLVEEGVLNPLGQDASPSTDGPPMADLRLTTSDDNVAPSTIVVYGLAEVSPNVMPSVSSDGVTESRVGPRFTSGEPSVSSHQQVERHRQEPLRDPAPDQSLHDRATSLFVQSRLTNNPTHLIEAIELYRHALLLRPEGHPERQNTLKCFGHAQLDKYLQDNDAARLEETIDLFRQTMDLRPNGHPGRCDILQSLGLVLKAKYNHHRNVADLDEAIDLIRQALLLRPEGHSERHTILHYLGIFLRTRYLHRRNVADLDEALDRFHRCLLLRPEGHSERHNTLQYLGHSLLDKYCESRDIAYVDEAADSYRQTLLLLPEGHPERADSIFSLATSIVHKYRQNGDATHLDEAIDLYHQALVFRPQGHPERPAAIQGLTYALVDKYSQDGDVSHLDVAINVIRPVLSQLPIGHSDSVNLQQLFDTVLVARSSAAIGSLAQED